MTNKMRDAINSVMANYDLSEPDVLRLLAAGAEAKRDAAWIDFEDLDTERKMKFVRDHALDWVEFMEGGDC